MKKIICLFLILSLSVNLFALGTSESNKDEASITLTAWYYADQGASEGYEIWAKQVNEKYPYINIEFEELPYDSGPEKFTVSVATNTNPDFYFDIYSRCASAIFANRTLDVTDLRERYADKFISPQVDGIVDGKYHAIVTNTGAAYCLFINMSLVKEAGLEQLLPEDHLTWSYDEYLTFLRALKKAYPDIYPMDLFAGSQSSDMWYYSWLIGNGVKLTNETLTATTFNNEENREKALQTLNLFKTIIDEGLCNPGAATIIDQAGQEYWTAGRSVVAHGAYSNTPSWYRMMQEGTSLEFEYDAYAMPTFEGTSIPYSGSLGSYCFIAFDSGDEYKNNAIKKAIEVYLENPECQNIVTNVTGRLSVMTDTEVEYATTEIAQIMERATEYSAKYTDSSFGVLESWWTEFRGTFYPNLQDFYAGNIDAGTMLDRWQARGDEVIASVQ